MTNRTELLNGQAMLIGDRSNSKQKDLIRTDKRGIMRAVSFPTRLETMIEKTVSFDQIFVREYALELGDNPSCKRGPPLTISWEFEELGAFDVERFEEERPPRRISREMIMPFEKREEILVQMGYSHTQILKYRSKVIPKDPSKGKLGFGGSKLKRLFKSKSHSPPL